MRPLAFLSVAALALSACAAAPQPPVTTAAETGLPVAGPGKSLPRPRATLTRIAFGSCHTAEKPQPILRTIAAERPDLFVYLGDNVYGDAKAGDMSLPELKEQYSKLAASGDFQALRAAAPMLATWDDHDYGLNDAGAEFPGRLEAERVFETFWGTAARTGARPGIYDSHMFGPAGRRVQVILLDTRFDRGPLARLPQRGPRGPYTASTAADQRMLSEAQWAWLADELRKPADVRIIASSVQVLADGHDFESWDLLPAEQQRLYQTVAETGAKGVVFVSGDRHLAALYRVEGKLPYPAYELTASSLNLSFRDESDEVSSGQIGAAYPKVNYGTIEIDWRGRALTMNVKDEAGAAVRTQRVPFADIGL